MICLCWSGKHDYDIIMLILKLAETEKAGSRFFLTQVLKKEEKKRPHLIFVDGVNCWYSGSVDCSQTSIGGLCDGNTLWPVQPFKPWQTFAYTVACLILTPSVIKLNVSCVLGRLKGVMITGNSLLYKRCTKCTNEVSRKCGGWREVPKEPRDE